MPRGFRQTKGALSPPGHQPRPVVYLQWPLDGCSAVYVREVVAVIHFPMDRPLPHGSCHYVLIWAARDRNSHKRCPNYFVLHYHTQSPCSTCFGGFIFLRVCLCKQGRAEPASALCEQCHFCVPSWGALASAPTSGARGSCSDTLTAVFLARELDFLSPISLCVLSRAVTCPPGIHFRGKGLTLAATSSTHEVVPTS